MSITSLRKAIATAGGVPATFSRVALWRQLVTQMGGTPTQHTVNGLIREYITAKGGTPTQFSYVPLLRQLITTLGGAPTSFKVDDLEAQTVTLVQMPLDLNFVTGTYQVGGASYASLSSSPGYTFTDGIDNLPNIAANGYSSLVAEASNLRIGTTLPDQDYFIWGTLVLPAPGGFGVLTTLDDGTTTNSIYLARNGAGNAEYTVTSAGASVGLGPAAGVIGAGRVVMGLRRRAGKFTGIIRAAGVTTLGTESGIHANPVGVTTTRVGVYQNNGLQPDAPIERLVRSAGTFTDAEIQAIVGAA